MHSHDRFTADTLPEPEVGDQPIFWADDTQYTLMPMGDHWILYGHFRRGKASPLGSIHRSEKGWRASMLGMPSEHDGYDLAPALRFLM